MEHWSTGETGSPDNLPSRCSKAPGAPQFDDWKYVLTSKTIRKGHHNSDHIDHGAQSGHHHMPSEKDSHWYLGTIF